MIIRDLQTLSLKTVKSDKILNPNVQRIQVVINGLEWHFFNQFAKIHSIIKVSDSFNNKVSI